jgi:hypothetical protein
VNAETASYIDFSNVANKPELVSSSAQILVGSTVWSSSAQLPEGTVSSSAQTINNLQSSNIVSSSAQVVANLTNQTLTVTSLTASNIQVINLSVLITSASTIYSSGSNIFGNDQTNIQEMTGSVQVTGSLTVTGGGISGNLTGTASYVNFSNIGNKPTLVSSSAQILVGSTVVSQSAQVVSLLSSQNVSVSAITSSIFAIQTGSSVTSNPAFSQIFADTSGSLNIKKASGNVTVLDIIMSPNAPTGSASQGTIWIKTT